MAAAGATGPRWTTQEDVAPAQAVVAGAEVDVDAVVCASDSLAIGLLAQTEGSARVPVIGFDNTPTAEALGFSSVEQREDVAAATLELLMGPTGETVTPRDVRAGTAHALIEPRLVVR
jgi:DNA-binding LacI/PurR family transcriptional regulator